MGQQNTHLIRFGGVIGRFDFCTNLVYLCMIGMLFSIPSTGYIMTHLSTAEDFLRTNLVFWQAPWLLKLWTLSGMAFIAYAGISLITRRISDINGKAGGIPNTIVSCIYALSLFGILMPFGTAAFLHFITFGTFLYLIFKKGEVTGKYPYDYTKEFNWGAFFGTWIWGLFNKSFKTLWMLLLWFTPWGGLFPLVCGFNGNKWASKNRKWENIEAFQKSQETQTIVFTIIFVLILPLIQFIVVAGLLGALFFTAIDEAETSPEHKSATVDTIDKKLNSAMKSMSSLYFESYEITDDENKFYVLPEDWESYSFTEKKEILDFAASVASSERDMKLKGSGGTKYEEVKRTKIYSSKTGELLGEYNFESDDYNLKSFIKAGMNAYRFYTPKK